MKKFFLFFVIFMLSCLLSAQEGENEPAAEQNEPAAAAEDAGEETGTAAEEVPAAENQDAEAQNAAQKEEAVPEIEEKPAGAAPEEAKKETPAQPAEAPAETAAEEPAKSETAQQPASEPVVKDEKPSKMFYNPSAGLGIGASIFSFRINNDFDFLLKHTAGGTDVYLGLEIDFRYSPYIDDHSIYEIPLQLNFLFDFPLTNRNVKRLALWFSGGVDLAFGYLSYYDYDDEYDDDGKDRDSRFKLMAAWGMGVTMIFHNDVTLKLGFDSFYGKYPDLVCVAGYRF